jgi:DnaJ like chaperone protein
MNVIDVVIILACLFVGYWVVSRLFSGKMSPSRAAQTNSQNHASDENSDNLAQTWHKILEVPCIATPAEIKQSYKALMSQYHPDKVAALGDEIRAVAERKSKELTRAYRYAMKQFGESS